MMPFPRDPIENKTAKATDNDQKPVSIVHFCYIVNSQHPKKFVTVASKITS